MSTISNIRRIFKAFSYILTMASEVITCVGGSIFMFKSDILDLKHLTEDLTIQKTVLDGKYVDVIGLEG